MSEFDDYHDRVSKRLIAATFAMMMLFDLMPVAYHIFFWLPSFTAMMLLYWAINRPQSVGIGVAFLVGILLDIGTAAPLGQHALSFMLMVFFIQRYQRQIILYSYGFQAIAVLIALFCNELVLMLIRLVSEHRFSDGLALISPIVGALLWPLISNIMLSILNFRRRR